MQNDMFAEQITNIDRLSLDLEGRYIISLSFSSDTNTETGCGETAGVGSGNGDEPAP